jgi:transposase
MNKQSLSKEFSNDKNNLSEYDHYVAIDWSQVNIALARSTRKNWKPQVIEWNKSEVKIVKEYLQKLRGSIILTIEETTTSHWLYVELKDYVDRIIICDPYRNRLLGDGPKTDKIDAKKLCKLLRAGLLKEVYHTCDTNYQLRQLVSAYDDLIKAGVRVQNQRSAVYRSLGHHYDKKNLSEMKERISDHAYAKIVSDWQDQTIEQYYYDKETFEKLISQIVRGNKKIKNQKGIPGIGDIFAIKIYSIVIQAERFKNKGHFWSYCGLVWHEKLSGKQNYGKRKPRFNRQLKSVYKTAARVAITSGNNPVYEYYETLIENGLTHKQATLMVARYIAKVSWGMLKSGEKYDPYKWRKDELDAA